MRLIVVPQAMRVILPPLTNQYLNLTKNSSLAVAIGYPDLVSVFAGTTLSQTGQAIEIIGITMGVIAAVRQNSWADYFAVGVTIGAQVVPNFVMAPILVLVFTLWLGWLPGGGWNGGHWSNVILPVIALATSYFASIARIMRSSMLEVLSSNYIRTARAKGLPGWQVIFGHALRPALLPVVSYLGPVFVGMVTGSVVIDLYFSTGGIGQAFVNSALNRDYSTILGITIMLGALTITANLVVDILYAWIDPKIKL